MPYLTMLADMMSRELPEAIQRLQELRIRHLDLRSSVFGRNIADLDAECNNKLAKLVESSGMEMYCFSSGLGHLKVDQVSEGEFRSKMMVGVDKLLETARHVKPAMIRLLACSFTTRPDEPDSNAYLERNFPWVYQAYRDGITAINAAGIRVTIENEPHSVLANPEETLGFFDRLNCSDRVHFTWDIQNMWASGTFPSLETYEKLRPIIGYVHTKGGCGRPGQPNVLVYRCPLVQATWPVHEIIGRVLADGVSPVICLNNSHGKDPAGDPEAPPDLRSYTVPEEAICDVEFLRENFKELE